jgi:hypothetical protein
VAEGSQPQVIELEPKPGTSAEATFEGFAVVAVGVYLIMVVIKGNATALWNALKQDLIVGTSTQPAFFKWAIAFFIFYALSVNEKTKVIGQPLFLAAVLAMVILIGERGGAPLQALQKFIGGL